VTDEGKTGRVGLTGTQNTSNLIAVSLAKPILLALLVVALPAYAFDCGASTNPERAMQCCNSMRCSSQGHEHSQDCCKTVPTVRAFYAALLCEGRFLSRFTRRAVSD
jgi:hypothetical protein